MPRAVASWISAIALALAALLLFNGRYALGVILFVVAGLAFWWYAKT